MLIVKQQQQKRPPGCALCGGGGTRWLTPAIRRPVLQLNQQAATAAVQEGGSIFISLPSCFEGATSCLRGNRTSRASAELSGDAHYLTLIVEP